MNRRDFLAAGGAGLLGAAGAWQGAWAETGGGEGLKIEWGRDEGSKLFDRVSVNGKPITVADGSGLVDGFCRVIGDGEAGKETRFSAAKPRSRSGPVRAALGHRLLRSTAQSGEDLLEATLTLVNTSDQPCEVAAGFLTGARPCQKATDQQVYLPLSAAGLGRADRLSDCRQAVGSDGLLAHYLEPIASDPRHTFTRATLLTPVVDVFAKDGPCHVALFGSSVQPAYFEALQGPASEAWRTGHRVRLAPKESKILKGYLFLHSADAAEAWAAFRKFAHRDEFPTAQWLKEVRVHYYDFLSPAEPGGPRGGGYDADLAHFRAFHVGMGTQHGYYFALGDYLNPDRKTWKAMPVDPKGPADMSLEKMRERIKATRQAGAHPMVYLHFCLFDDGTPLYEKLKDAIEVDSQGKPKRFGWQGPDVIKRSWKMSVASPEWRNHLVQQAQWVMELLDPDGIVLDETFTAWGYDHHPDRRGPLSLHGVELMRSLRKAVRSFGADKALLASDCSMSNFVLWADGEGGDHAYGRLLGHPLYRQMPIRYASALGDKYWRPCAWCFQEQWDAQMDLARKIHDGCVGVSNGWNETTGLAHLPAKVRAKMIADIETLLRA
ncbi:MAG: hypothetical protein JW818_19020 [Pirellulales bacterium]|nr:hypothetical protein [Pirellulales bacterium]